MITKITPDVIVSILQATRTRVEMILIGGTTGCISFPGTTITKNKAHKNARTRRNPNNAGVAATTFLGLKNKIVNYNVLETRPINSLPRCEDGFRKFQGRF